MPHMNGFELCEKILAIDINVKVCFMYSVEINRALREIYPIRLGCFIRKPVMDFLLHTYARCELQLYLRFQFLIT